MQKPAGCHVRVYIRPIQLCFNIHNDVKHAHLIYYLVIFPSNKTHFWFSLVWSRHWISIIFSLNINHGFVGDAFHLLLLLLKDSNGLLLRTGMGIRFKQSWQEAEEGMFCLKSAENSLFPRLFLSHYSTVLWLQFKAHKVLSGDFFLTQADNNLMHARTHTH